MDGTAWAMAAHIITLGVWSAALLVLAALYAMPPETTPAAMYRHKLMCRYLFVMLGSPAAVVAIISGCILVVLRGADGSWLLAKLAVVALLALYHAYCGKLLHAQEGSASWLRPSPGWKSPLLIGVPVLLISVILILVLAKPDVVLEYQLAPQPAGHGYQHGTQQGQIQTTAFDGAKWIFQTG